VPGPACHYVTTETSGFIEEYVANDPDLPSYLRIEERGLEADGRNRRFLGLCNTRPQFLFGGGQMAAILFVRIKSGLDVEEFDRRLAERLPRFREVPGLVQKIYGRDDATGDVCGIYFFENDEALAAFRETELAQTIPAAYEAVDVRREAYDVLYPLWPERGPLSSDS
jgi:Putative mono-oxygenase ydhR